MSETLKPIKRSHAKKSDVTREEEMQLSEPHCYVHTDIDERSIQREIIRKKVCCYELDRIKHTDGNYYCLFHLPTQQKNVVEFERLFKERVEQFDSKVDSVRETLREKLSSEEYSYDFSYVWFPRPINFVNKTFSSSVRFYLATFSGTANFSGAKFKSEVIFHGATFIGSAIFGSTTFDSDVYFVKSKFLNKDKSKMTALFGKATFLKKAVFSETEFEQRVVFTETSFSGNVYFSKAIFNDIADFRACKILESSQFSFKETKFESQLLFSFATINGFVTFTGSPDNLLFNIFNGKNPLLDLQEAKIANSEKILFRRMRLCPSWFVNIDSRKFNFIDVTWENLDTDIDRSSLNEEINSLIEREVIKPHKFLIEACNQLADNAEANRRFDESKKFKKLSLALKSYQCHIHDKVDLRDKEYIREKVCQNYPVVNEEAGNYYCLLHNPDKNKSELFREEFEKMLTAKHSDFQGVDFPIALRFDGELPKKLDFSHATFQRQVLFHEAKIHKLIFDKAHFNEDSELIFEYSTCEENITFEKTVFDGKLFLNGKDNYEFFKKTDYALQLKDARFNNPQLVNFRSVRLRPHYFVDVDASKFIFHDCNWNNVNGKDLDIKKEITKCSHKALAQTCNQLAINYEEARQFEESSYFRYTAMEAKRLSNQGWRRILNLYWFYKQTSEYGENWIRAFYWLVLIWIYFALVYWLIGNFQDDKTIRFLDSFGYSLQVMTLQKPEPRPVGWFTILYYGLQTILAPLQAALLALAIRRKFMR